MYTLHTGPTPRDGNYDTYQHFLKQGLALSGVGLAFGLMGCWGVTRLMSSLLFGVNATDTTTLFAVGVGLLIITLAACYLPARKATKIDPLIALKYE